MRRPRCAIRMGSWSSCSTPGAERVRGRDRRSLGTARGHPRARGRPHPRRPVRRNAARRPRRGRHQDRTDRGRPVPPGRVAVRRRAQRLLREHQPQQAQRARRSHDGRGTGRARRAREDRPRAAREPAPVDDPQARARLRVDAPVQPEDRVRGAHRVRARRPGGGMARLRLRDPGDHRRGGHDGRARRAADAGRLLGGRQLGGNHGRARPRREGARREGRPGRRLAASTSCSRSSTTRPPPT